MFSWQTNKNGQSRLDFNTKTGKFELKVDLNSGKHIRKSYYFYKHAMKVLARLRKKYDLNQDWNYPVLFLLVPGQHGTERYEAL